MAWDRCSRCGNEDEGDEILQCRHCGTIYCSACGPGGWDIFNPQPCPECDDLTISGYPEVIGHIGEDDDE